MAKIQPLFSTDDVVYLNTSCIDLVKQFVNENTIKLFGYRDLEEIVNLSSLIMGLKEPESKSIVAIMCLYRYPNVSAVPSWEWYDWFKNLYGIENVNSRNTYFIHLMVFDNRYTPFVMHPMSRLLFRMRTLEYVFLVIPPGIQKIDFMDPLATRILPKGQLNPRTVQSLFMLIKQNFVKKYKIRRAVEEDNDDLVPLIDMYSTKLKKYYGEYYIAELLTRHTDCGRQIIVAEHDSIAVGIICLNENVSYDALNEEFELIPYNGFKKPVENEESTLIGVENEDEMDLLSQISRTPEKLSSTWFPLNEAEGSSDESSTSLNTIDIHDSISSEFSLVLLVDSDESNGSAVGSDMGSYENLAEYEEHLTRTHAYYEHHKGYTQDLSTKRSEYLLMIEKSKLPLYEGDPNAFVIEISLTHPDHLMVMSQLYEAAFECFPDREYCILSHPYILSHPLLQSFMFVPPRPRGHFPNALYLLHRNSLVGQMVVRLTQFDDTPNIKKLLKSLTQGPLIFEQYESSVESPFQPYLSFVLTCDDQIIGLAVIKEEHDMDYLITHFKLDEWFDIKFHRSGSHGLLENLILCPVFNKIGRFFLGELHRLTDFSVIYYKLNPIDHLGSEDRVYLNTLNYMTPVRPRTLPYYSIDVLNEYPLDEHILRKTESYALYVSVDSILGHRSSEYNTRIVVVGASDIALAFLESLFMRSPKEKVTIFHNVTLVCTHTLSRQKIPARIKEYLFVQNGFDRDNFMNTFSPLTFVNIAYGVMTAINRKEQYIVIDDISYLPYDLLFLTCGEQFQRNSVRPDVHVKKEKPSNVYVINSEIDGLNAFTNLKSIKKRRKGDKIIVYGHFLETHCCLATLLAYGIPGNQLVYIEPFPHNANFDGVFRHNVAFYNDPEVDEAVMDNIRQLGIKVYQGYYFHDWVYIYEENMISQAKFESEYQYLQVKCWAMFFYIGKSVSPRTFNSIIQAGLVFDGRLIIDAKCRTNDPRIYGAGTLTRYARHYDADHLAHKYYNKKEVGTELAKQVKDQILKDITIEHTFQPRDPEKLQTKLQSYLVRAYTKPMITYCRLPGGLYYLNVRKPGIRVPLEAALSRSDYGIVLVTGDCKNLRKQGYFRLHLNRFNKVETITCLTKFPIEVNNLVNLYGKHELLLNNLRVRFEMVLIKDLFAFFREPWAYALYYDKFESFWQKVDDFMANAKTDTGENYSGLLEKLFEMNQWKKLNDDQTEEIDELFYGSEDHKKLEQLLIQFLEQNNSFLSMYGTPMKTKKILNSG